MSTPSSSQNTEIHVSQLLDKENVSPDTTVGDSLSQPASNKRFEEIPVGEQCAVCCAKSSGIHYGAMTCEACKCFFRRCKTRPIVTTCLKHNKCQKVTRCQSCRWKKCLEVGMDLNSSRQSPLNSIPLPSAPEEAVPPVVVQVAAADTCDPSSPPGETLMRIIDAYKTHCDYTEEKVKGLVERQLDWTVDEQLSNYTNRLFAWQEYSKDFQHDIESTGLFIRSLSNYSTEPDSVIMFRKKTFQIHCIQISRVLSIERLLLPDGRAIPFLILEYLYGFPMAEEMVSVAEKIRKLNDDDIALLAALIYFQPIEHKLQNPTRWINSFNEYQTMISHYYKMKKSDKYAVLMELLSNINYLDEMNKEVMDWLHKNEEYFEGNPLFREIYLNL